MTTENSVQKKFVSAAMLVAPVVLGAVFAFSFGFTAPEAAKADGDWDYSNPTSGDDWSTYSYPDDSWSTYNYPDSYSNDDWSTYNYPDSYSNDDWSTYSYPDQGYNNVTADYWNPVTADYWNPVTVDYDNGYGGYGNYGGYDYGSGYGSYPTYSYSYYPSSYSYSNTPYSYYSYDYVEDTYYEYEHVTEYDECTNIPGLQSRGYDCYPDRHHNNDDLDCELTASDRTVEEGDRVTLEWDVDGDADYASINQGVGRVDEDGGEERVRVDEDTTYRLTVRDGNDEATCSVTVRVEDEDNTFSSIDFEGEPANNPPQVVYLSSIPYTGLEDITPAMLSYWLMLIAGAGMLGWFLYRNGFVPSFAFAKSEPTDGETAPEEAPVGDEAPATTANAFVSALEDGNVDAAIDALRDGAATGTSIEDALEQAAKAAEGTALESRVSAALDASRVNGIRGVKASLAV